MFVVAAGSFSACEEHAEEFVRAEIFRDYDDDYDYDDSVASVCYECDRFELNPSEEEEGSELYDFDGVDSHSRRQLSIETLMFDTGQRENEGLVIIDDEVFMNAGKSNNHGQLGNGSCCKTVSSTTAGLERIELFVRTGVKISKVCVGLFHTVCLEKYDGAVYAFGSNESGQIGAPKHVKFSTIPRLIEGSIIDTVHFKFIGCGSRHTLIASTTIAFAFGANSKAQCFKTPKYDDDDDDDDEEEHSGSVVYEPQKILSIRSSRDEEIKSVQCGRWSSFIVVDTNSA